MLLRPQGFQAVFEARRKKQKQKQESQAKAGHTHTQNFPLNDIKKEDEKQHLKDLSQHVHSLPFSLFFIFFFCSGCTIARWRGEWLPVRLPRASIDLHRVQKLNNSTHAHMACRQSL